MYLPRSRAGIFDHVFSYARLAAFTARSTSSSDASATSLSFFSVAGLTVSKYSPLTGATNLPPMNSSYRGATVTFAVSGAGAYVQSVEKLRLTEDIAGSVYHANGGRSRVGGWCVTG